MMIMQKVRSSAIKAIGYIQYKSELYLEFNKGVIYMYAGVPKDVYAAFFTCGSKGRYFDDAVKGKYPVTTWYGYCDDQLALDPSTIFNMDKLYPQINLNC